MENRRRRLISHVGARHKRENAREDRHGDGGVPPGALLRVLLPLPLPPGHRVGAAEEAPTASGPGGRT